MATPHSSHLANHEDQKILQRSKPALIGFFLAAAYFLFTEHRAHVVAFLPYLLLLACPLMHIFMHGGHGGHGRHSHAGNQTQDEKGEL